MNSPTEIKALLATKELLIFDLDGTLFNTLGDLAPAVNYALRQFNLKEHDNEAVRSFIGNGSMNLIRRALCKSLDQEFSPDLTHVKGIEVALVHKVYSDFYWDHCIENTKPYENVLNFLASTVKRCAVLTNKPSKPCTKILQHFGIFNSFEICLCGDTAKERKPSPAGIYAILEQTRIPKEKAVMIGDDTPDLLAARNAGIDCITLLHGFGKAENLLPLEPMYTTSHIKDF